MARSAASRWPPSAALRYGLAIGSVALAAAITTGPGGERLVPEPPERFVHGVTLLYAAAILSAWLGERGPGALAALLAALVVDVFITPPLYSITLDGDFLLRISVFALSALLVGWLSVRRHRTEEARRRARDQLEQRVADRTADLTRSNRQLHDEIAARARAEETLREHRPPRSQPRHRLRARRARRDHLLEPRGRGAVGLEPGRGDRHRRPRAHADRLPVAAPRADGGGAPDRPLGGRAGAHSARRHPGGGGEPLGPTASGRW